MNPTEQEKQQKKFEDLQSQINNINMAIEAHYQEHGPARRNKTYVKVKKTNVNGVVTEESIDILPENYKNYQSQ